jgi:threonine dehydrogenase-like Zn-dependent dehydrogenase
MIEARIAVLEQPRRLVFKQERLDPSSLKEGQLLCETLVTAISPGTEVAAYLGAPPLRPGVIYPRFVGYCNIARVLQASPASGFGAGDRILTFASHRSHFVIAADDVLAKLSSTLRSEDAVCAYLFHLGYNAVLGADIRAGSSVVVVGMGVLGLTSIAISALAGARVYGISDHARPRELGRTMGAAGCFDRSQLPALMEAIGVDRANAVITTSNSWADWRTALECAGNRGTIAVLGFPGRGQEGAPFNPLDSAHFYTRQLRIVAAGMSPQRPDGRGFQPFNERDNLRRILAWISEGALKPSLLVSGEVSAGDLDQAYQRLVRRDGAPLTYLLRWAA